MPTISANTTQTITLAASTLMRGIGAAVLSWGTPLQTVTHTAGDEWHFGPFTAAQAVSIHAQSLLTYSTQAVSDDDPVDKLGLKFDGGLTAAQVQAVQAMAADDGNSNLLAAATGNVGVDMSIAAQTASVSDAISRSLVTSFVATQASRRVRVAWVDLRLPRGATTNAAGYAAGIKTISLASAGTGAFYKGDVILFAGQDNEYTVLAGDADVSNGGSITLAGYGLAAAIAASATAITLVRRGARALLALDCDNAVEGLIATQDERRRDAELVLGWSMSIQAPVPISSLWASADVSVLNTAHRLDVTFGD